LSYAFSVWRMEGAWNSSQADLSSWRKINNCWNNLGSANCWSFLYEYSRLKWNRNTSRAKMLYLVLKNHPKKCCTCFFCLRELSYILCVSFYILFCSDGRVERK
jgi:hypothetical protein